MSPLRLGESILKVPLLPVLARRVGEHRPALLKAARPAAAPGSSTLRCVRVTIRVERH